MNNDMQKFAQSIYRTCKAFDEMNQPVQAGAISVALHTALDEAGIANGEARREFLGADKAAV